NQEFGHQGRGSTGNLTRADDRVAERVADRGSHRAMIRALGVCILCGSLAGPAYGQDNRPSQPAPDATSPAQAAARPPVLSTQDGRFYTILLSCVIGVLLLVAIVGYIVQGQVHAGIYFLTIIAFLMAWLGAFCFIVYLTATPNIDTKIVASIFVIFGALSG